MPIDWTPFVDLVRSHQRFLLTTHIRPDGDGLGSMLALADVLEAPPLSKNVCMTVASTLPPRYDFLDPARRIVRFEPPGDVYRDADAVIVLDTGTWNQLGDFGALLRSLPVAKAVLDHHLTQDDLDAQRFVDTTAEATGRLVFEAVTALRASLPASAAHSLFVALAMDTGWFRHANTTPATFALAADLVRAGARPTEAYECLFERNTLGRLKLMGLVLSRLQTTHGGRVAHTAILRDDYAVTGALPQDSEDLVNHTRSLAGVEVGLFFMEQPRGGVKVSFRSRRVDVARLAEQFGGGGHRLASGAILETTLDEARKRVLAAVGVALDSPSEPSAGVPVMKNPSPAPTSTPTPTPTPTPTFAPPDFTLRELPLPVRLTLSLFLIAVGLGYLAALVQLHFQHSSKGNPLPTANDVVAIFSGIDNWGGPPKGEVSKELPPLRCQLECLIMGPEKGAPFNGTGSMAPAFFEKDSDFKKKIKKKPQGEAKLRSEREGERLVLQAWIKAPPEERKKAYDDDAFPLPDNLAKRPLTEDFRDGRNAKVQSIIEDRCLKCHGTAEQEGKSALDTYEALEKYMKLPKAVVDAEGKTIVKSSRQMSVERLTQSTHLHALSFAVLFTLTGLVFAFSSYPLWMRCLLAPLVLLAQVTEVSCWWLARLDNIGPYFALTIVGAGAVVGTGLMLQIVLSLFNMYRWPGKVVLLLLFAVAGLGAASLTPQVQEYLKQECPIMNQPSATLK